MSDELAADDLDFVRFVERVARFRFPPNIALEVQPTLYRREKEGSRPVLDQVDDELIALLQRLEALELPANMSMRIVVRFHRRAPRERE